jgi:hypothetical protein
MVDGGLRGLFRAKLPGHWQSIESGLTGTGTPDANYCIDGIEGWVEFKATKGWKVTMRPGQIGWIFKRTLHGGRVWIAIRRKEDELWLVPGALVRVLAREGLRDFAGAYVWKGGPRLWDWPAILDTLRMPPQTLPDDAYEDAPLTYPDETSEQSDL